MSVAREKDGPFSCHPHRCFHIPVGIGEMAFLQVGHMFGDSLCAWMENTKPISS